jgi:hypothetical protein
MTNVVFRAIKSLKKHGYLKLLEVVSISHILPPDIIWRNFESQARQGLAGMRWDEGDVCPAETPERAELRVLCPSMAGTKSLILGVS